MVSLASVFSSHMVLQANKPVRFFGKGSGAVSVTLEGREHRAIANGEWLLELPPMPYGGPYSITVLLDGREVCLEDVWFGDVYLMGGQSNMQFKLGESNEPVEDYRGDDGIRLYTVDRLEDKEHFHSFDGWVTLTAENAGYFSAIGYYVAHALRARRGDRKIGLLACYQGASAIQAWMPKEVTQEPRFQVQEKFIDHRKFPIWNIDGLLFEKMLSTLFPYSMAGAWWYQGESNTSPEESALYLQMLDALIGSWRKHFQDENLPFVVVQLADYLPRVNEWWRAVQAAQMEASQAIPNVFTAVCRDVCETDNIHPKSKRILSERIAAYLN